MPRRTSGQSGHGEVAETMVSDALGCSKHARPDATTTRTMR